MFFISWHACRYVLFWNYYFLRIGFRIFLLKYRKKKFYSRKIIILWIFKECSFQHFVIEREDSKVCQTQMCLSLFVLWSNRKKVKILRKFCFRFCRNFHSFRARFLDFLTIFRIDLSKFVEIERFEESPDSSKTAFLWCGRNFADETLEFADFRPHTKIN